jgi:hypothetical protein
MVTSTQWMVPAGRPAARRRAARPPLYVLELESRAPLVDRVAGGLAKMASLTPGAARCPAPAGLGRGRS